MTNRKETEPSGHSLEIPEGFAESTAYPGKIARILPEVQVGRIDTSRVNRVKWSSRDHTLASHTRGRKKTT